MCACSMQQDPPARTMLVLFSVEGKQDATKEMHACSMQQDPPSGTMDLLFSVEGNKMQQQKCVPAQCNKIHQLEQCLFCSLLKATRCNKRSMCACSMQQDPPARTMLVLFSVEGNKMQHTEMCACSMQQDPPARTMLVLFSVEGNKMQQQKCVPAQALF